MNINKYNGYIILLLLIFANNLKARPLYLEITGGKISGLPMVVAPLQIKNKNKEVTKQVINITKVIANDLSSSGQFYILPDAEFKKGPWRKSSNHLAYWRNLGMENLLVVTAEQTDVQHYNIEVKLVDLYSKNIDLDVAKSKLLKKFNNVNVGRFRALAHHIADQVFRKLIGIPGVFSTRIAYISKNLQRGAFKSSSLVVADADGFGAKELYRSSYPIMSPTWSPDGTQIAFVSFENHETQILIIDILTGKVTKLKKFKGVNSAPAWSPDGKDLALVLSKDGTPKLYIYNIAKQKFSKITHGGSFDTNPKWYPDGRSIYFTSNRGGSLQIYNIILKTGAISRITFTGNYNADPAITPDGKNLVMMHRNKSGIFTIAALDLVSGKLKILSEAEMDQSPSIAPNGKMVIYESRMKGNKVLKAISLDGRFTIKLPTLSNIIQEPVWSPFLF